MSYMRYQPFVNSHAFVWETKTYIPFPSQTDAMLASLQLFHDVPCHIMDLFLSVVTHPDFDSKQVTLRKSVDVIDIVEENRVNDRMATMHKRSLGDDGRMEQAGFPSFVLDEVLDIIHAERMECIRARFEETLDAKMMFSASMHFEEDDTLKAMSHVHRSWTTPAQKVLGRVFHIGRPIHEMDDALRHPVQKSIFGPWTSVVAVQFFHPILPLQHIDSSKGYPYRYVYDFCVRDEYRLWFENLHRILVSFTNLKSIMIKSYAQLFTIRSNPTVLEILRRNMHLEEITLYAQDNMQWFNLNPLAENVGMTENLRSLKIRGASFSYVALESIRRIGFPCLSDLTIKCYAGADNTNVQLLSILSAQSDRHGPRLKSLCIADGSLERPFLEEELILLFTPVQCTAMFEHLRALHINSNGVGDKWLQWISPYCSRLQAFTLTTQMYVSSDVLYLVPTTVEILKLRLLYSPRLEKDLILGWFEGTLKILSSGHFAGLKEFELRLFESKSIDPETGRLVEQGDLLAELHDVAENMRTVCQDIDVACNLRLTDGELESLTYRYNNDAL